ncbi:MAG: hypothetical protein LBS53_11210 [Synergistaceae bacterium]|nr:hypothetical protein [Synergistaceae bacterium]
MARLPQSKFFRSVKAISGHQLEIVMDTNSFIIFDFGDRLQSIRFSVLQEAELFNTAHTDGFYLLFGEDDKPKVKISPSDLMDLLMTDRTREFPHYRDYESKEEPTN